MKSMKTVRLSFFLLLILLLFSSSSATYPNLSDYPTFLSPGLYIVVGKEGSATDVLVSTEIATSIKGELPSITVETKLDGDIVNPYEINRNFLLIGNPCTNKLIALIMNKAFPSCGSDSGIPENSAIVKIYDGFKSGYYTLVISGWNDTYTRIAASVLKNHDRFLSDKFVKAVKITSESYSGITPYYEEILTSTSTSAITTTSTALTTSTTTQTMIVTSTLETTTIPIEVNEREVSYRWFYFLFALVMIIALLIFCSLKFHRTKEDKIFEELKKKWSH